MPKIVRTLQLIIIIACLLLLISLPAKADVYGEALYEADLPLSAEAELSDGVYWNGSADDR
ncbi:MAG: hypothetical protein IKM70_02085, partial [Firmicutes bacterium]|nr:hypothetical protein [Bacillota bacterium]